MKPYIRGPYKLPRPFGDDDYFGWEVEVGTYKMENGILINSPEEIFRASTKEEAEIKAMEWVEERKRKKFEEIGIEIPKEDQ